jgi:ABC-type transport system involved in cytochrome c biogenesis ATPase subunit
MRVHFDGVELSVGQQRHVEITRLVGQAAEFFILTEVSIHSAPATLFCGFDSLLQRHRHLLNTCDSFDGLYLG